MHGAGGGVKSGALGEDCVCKRAPHDDETPPASKRPTALVSALLWATLPPQLLQSARDGGRGGSSSVLDSATSSRAGGRTYPEAKQGSVSRLRLSGQAVSGAL